jgi:hypothetical protein
MKCWPVSPRVGNVPGKVLTRFWATALPAAPAGAGLQNNLPIVDCGRGSLEPRQRSC